MVEGNYTNTGEGDVMTEAESRVMWPRNSGSHQSLRQEKDSPLRAS